ncbi:uncharacterized protein isoform X2 [Danio rerio]|uniref:Uncharacterized protein isoform X2 n=2 Tax=Danio rerio TaxID=7955 RepID=A0AC58I0R6_DANRE
MSLWLLMIWVSHAMGSVTEPSIVTQWPMVAEVTAGEDVVLKCNIIELYSSCSAVTWLRVNSENATISLTNRLQMDAHNSESVKSICTAVITNSTVQDSSIYYCAAVHGRFAHIGNGSRVIVKEHTVLPVIDILTPLIKNAPLVPLQCVVTGAKSSQVQMHWSVEGRKEKGQAVLRHGNDGAVQISRNQILITAEQWERKIQCVCVVELGGQIFTKSLQTHADSTEMASIEIMAFTSSNNHDPTVTLQCTLSGFAPSQVSMYWLIGSRRENGQTLFVWDEGKENSVKTQNYVDISEEEWKTGTESTCIVNLGGRTFTKTLNHDDIQETCYPVISPQSLKNFPDAIFHLRFRTATAN